MRKITHLYFDMDGVLADFNRGVIELCHMEPIKQGSGPAADDVLWSAIQNVPHFYAHLQPVPGSREMFHKLYLQYGNICEILTGIPKPHRQIENAGEDKINWVHHFLGNDIKVNIVFREEKKLYCHEMSDLLIDDYEKNIKEWKKFGGTGIQFISPSETLKAIHQFETES